MKIISVSNIITIIFTVLYSLSALADRNDVVTSRLINNLNKRYIDSSSVVKEEKATSEIESTVEIKDPSLDHYVEVYKKEGKEVLVISAKDDTN
jgi:hypothetical protein